MEKCHSHDILSSCKFVDNATKKVGLVTKKKTIKVQLGSMDNGVLVQLVQQTKIGGCASYWNQFVDKRRNDKEWGWCWKMWNYGLR